MVGIVSVFESTDGNRDITHPSTHLCGAKASIDCFGIVVLMWVFRTQPFGGWTELFPSMRIGDDTIALFGVVLAFTIPSGTDQKRLLDWDTAKDIPWGLLLLFGGGIAIATAFKESGLSLVVETTVESATFTDGGHDWRTVFGRDLFDGSHQQYSNDDIVDADSSCCGDGIGC